MRLRWLRQRTDEGGCGMNVTVLIPSYEPEDRLVGYVDELAARGFGRIVVVDDGSGESYRGIFDRLRERPFCTVLHHAVNRGKGAALKTGFAYIHDRQYDSVGVVTADADGQHSSEDCVRMAEALIVDPASIHIGSRDFSFGRIPFRSWIGNRWSSLSFALVLGRWLPDTQTGLRAFPSSFLPLLMSLRGERYEYEMGVLMASVRRGLSVKTLSISTIYENGNACSHFSPIMDTIRINSLVLADFIRFAGVSIVSFIVDQGLAWFFAAALHMAGVERSGVIWASGFAARLVSSVFNFSLNRSFVFKSNCRIASSAWKYAFLCMVVIVLSNAGVTALSFVGMPRGVAKFACDILLYFIGYGVQARFIFRQ